MSMREIIGTLQLSDFYMELTITERLELVYRIKYLTGG